MPKVQENLQISYIEVTEQKRLNETREEGIPRKRCGLYLSERQPGRHPGTLITISSEC